MTADEMYKNLHFVVLNERKIVVAAFTDNYDAMRYADRKCIADDQAYLVEKVTRTTK